MANTILLREFNGVQIRQNSKEGFINATAMAVANDKDLAQWFRTKETLDLFCALAEDLGLELKTGILQDSDIARLSASKYSSIFPKLVTSKRGSPENGGGTWLHPDLSIQLAQWCSPRFAIQVSKWVREWMTTGKKPTVDDDLSDRLYHRTELKDSARKDMCDQIKAHLEAIQRYDDKKYAGYYFSYIHDYINVAITGETASQMKQRLKATIGKDLKSDVLIRDYFPAGSLQQFTAVCNATANYIDQGYDPKTAVQQAVKIALPMRHQPKAIDFTQNVYQLAAARFSGKALAN